MNISAFVNSQLLAWPLAAKNFKALDEVLVREVEVGGLTVRLQFNPARMISSAASLSKEAIAARKCFLCGQNRPPEQSGLDFTSRKGNEYHILVNPYPIFPEHLVIALAEHRDQSICGRYEDMLDLAKAMPDRTVFYNGPKSGASAPDHHHFQAAPAGVVPLELDVESSLDKNATESPLVKLSSASGAVLYRYTRFTTGIYVIKAQSESSAASMFYNLISDADKPQGETEPLFNLFTYYREGTYTSIIIFRRSHRSHHYFSDGPDHLTMSPGCADMGGVFIVPVKDEFEKITPELLTEMVDEISLPRAQSSLNVGIMSAEEIGFEILADGKGMRKASYSDGRIEFEGELHDELYFKADTYQSRFAPASFVLDQVTIGVDFHWERQEKQVFAGDLKIIVDGNRLRAINVIGVEDYLLSVISSEMSATASEEFLKAHAVISRSWVMARIEAGHCVVKPGYVDNLPKLVTWLYDSMEVAVRTGNEYIKWYDHDDHKLFDVCADDHCQRYQGLSRVTGEIVRKVIGDTWGQVLMYDGKLCDARFSKCCGGKMETFGTCWQDKEYPYLQALADTPGHDPEGESFCNTADAEILGQVLNNYDQETVDFYSWTEDVDPVALGGLIERKFGVMTGKVMALEPLERGESGRICKLRIVGELKTIEVGKELEIRRILSETHLKSSAFDVEYMEDGKIRLKGRGWGHGVGLCQIGAAVMASKGYDYRQILSHYYPGSLISNNYED